MRAGDAARAGRWAMGRTTCFGATQLPTQARLLRKQRTYTSFIRSTSFIDFIKLKRNDEKTFACLDVKIQYVSRLLSVRSGQVCVLFVKSHVIVRGSIRL